MEQLLLLPQLVGSLLWAIIKGLLSFAPLFEQIDEIKNMFYAEILGIPVIVVSILALI